MADILPVSQMIQQPNLLAGYQQGVQFGQAQRDRRNSQQAAQLYAQAMQAPVEQRPALLAQIAQLTGVEGATSAQAGLGRQDTAAHDDLVQTAGQFAAIAEADPATAQQMYPALAAKAHAIGIPVPTTYDPRMLPAIQKLAMAGGGPGGSVQSTYIDDQGQRVAIMRDGTRRVIGANAPNMQIIDNGQGFYGVNKSNLAASPVTMGGATQQAAPTQFTGADGRPVQIDPNLPPAVQASIRANEGAYAQAPNMATAQIGPPPQQLRSMPKPADIRAEQTQAMQIAEFNAKQSHTLSPAEVAARGYRPGTIVQVDGFGNEKVTQTPPSEAAGGRLSQTQLRQVNAAKQKLIDLQSVRNQLALVQQKFAPLKDSLAAGPFGAGYLPTEDGKRYDAAVALLQQFVRKLTRTPGEGSMSDWEGKLAMLANPSRNDYESVTQDKIDQLNSLVNQIEQGYRALLEDNQQASPGGGASQGAGRVLRYNPTTGKIE
jgi:hypothetical protein